MGGRLASLVLVCLASNAAGAKAQTVYDDFHRLCVSTHADVAATRAAVVVMGWKPVKAAAAPAVLPRGATMTSVAMWSPNGTSNSMTLISGVAVAADAAGVSPTRIRSCLLLSAKPDPISVSAAKAAVQGAPFLVSGPTSFYAVDTASGHVATTQASAATQGFRAGSLALMLIIDSPTTTGFSYQSRAGTPR